MTVRVERTFELNAPPEEVWEFIADPEKRAQSISVISSFERRGDSEVWHVELPIPFIRKTIAVDTHDVERRPPNYVKFTGRSSVMRVVGEHEIAATETGSRVSNRFLVDGMVPGVERFFERNLDDELANLERAIREEVAS